MKIKINALHIVHIIKVISFHKIIHKFAHMLLLFIVSIFEGLQFAEDDGYFLVDRPTDMFNILNSLR